MSKEIKELWKRQSWDTPASYSAFAGYYLTQDPPRSVDKAYRLQKGNAGDTKKRASNSYRFWSQGKDRSGKQIPDAISWEKRANAWDDFQRQLAFEQEMRERLEKRKQRREMIGRGYHNVMAMLDKFDPTKFDPDKLATNQDEFVRAMAQLTNALRVIGDQMRSEYDDQPTQNVQHSGQITTKTAPVVKVYLPDNGRNDRNS